MGGRGATLITQSKREDEGTLIQDERLKKMLQADDPESEYHNGMFRVLKRLGWSTRKSTDKNQDVNLMDQQDVVRDITKEYSKQKLAALEIKYFRESNAYKDMSQKRRKEVEDYINNDPMEEISDLDL